MRNKCEEVFWHVRNLQKKALLITLLVLTHVILLCVPVNAQEAGNIIVSSTVPPLRSIIIDNDNNIIEITSNTKEKVTPQVCVIQCKQEIVELSIQTFQEYQGIIKTVGYNRIGIVYQKPANQSSPKATNLNWLLIKQQVSRLSII